MRKILTWILFSYSCKEKVQQQRVLLANIVMMKMYEKHLNLDQVFQATDIPLKKLRKIVAAKECGVNLKDMCRISSGLDFQITIKIN